MTERAVAGRYVLEEALGSFSWRATDTELGRQVLVRFGETASAVLSHPSIARVFDQGEDDGERYAVLEFLPGGTLAERLPELGEREAHAVAADVAAALEYAHAQGVVHGFLSLDNILFDAEGRAKVAGFGGSGTPEEDMQALAAILESLAQVAPTAVEEQTAVMTPLPLPQAAGRRTAILVAAAALVLLVGGVSAAFLATGDSTTDVPTGSLSVPVPSQTTFEETEAPPPPTDTAETTTTATTTTEAEPTTAPTTAPPPTVTLPPPLPTTVELPPTTTEEPPPTTTEAIPPPPTDPGG